MELLEHNTLFGGAHPGPGERAARTLPAAPAAETPAPGRRARRSDSGRRSARCAAIRAASAAAGRRQQRSGAATTPRAGPSEARCRLHRPQLAAEAGERSCSRPSSTAVWSSVRTCARSPARSPSRRSGRRPGRRCSPTWIPSPRCVIARRSTSASISPTSFAPRSILLKSRLEPGGAPRRRSGHADCHRQRITIVDFQPRTVANSGSIRSRTRSDAGRRRRWGRVPDGARHSGHRRPIRHRSRSAAQARASTP